MANISLADQLDDAIEIMIAEPHSAPPKVDLKIGELLGIAAELRLLPDPAFRAALRAELLGQDNASRTAVQRDLRAAGTETADVQRDARADAILPTLFGKGYGNFPLHRGNIAISMAMHAVMLAVIAAAGWWMGDRSEGTLQVFGGDVFGGEIVFTLPADARNGGGGGGGGNDLVVESKGALPRFASEQLTPPTIVVRNEPPKLAVDPTLVGPPELMMPPTSQVGNPLSEIFQTPSNGVGSNGGLGEDHNGGIGSGSGPGFGSGRGGGIGSGDGIYSVGGGVSAPRAIYDPDPEYSNEARQAKYQGTVYLSVVVDAEGRPRDIRVQRSLGMGLDEKAIEAVRGWRFEPGRKDGRTVAVQVVVEVSFRLL